MPSSQSCSEDHLWLLAKGEEREPQVDAPHQVQHSVAQLWLQLNERKNSIKIAKNMQKCKHDLPTLSQAYTSQATPKLNLIMSL